MKNKILMIALSVLLGTGFSSCDDWLDLKPESEILLEDFWKSKADVEAVLAACYKSLTERACIERMIAWGELRSDNMVMTNGFPSDREIYDLYLMLQGNLTSNNRYASWASFYTVINYCNNLLHYAEGVTEIDNNFTRSDLNLVQGEALTLRALAYFYLVRAFKEVPYIEDPSIDDTQDYRKPKVEEDSILTRITEDLEFVLQNNYVRESYGKTEYDKGRITKSAVNALLADVYLWKEEYAKCIEACDAVIADNNLELILNPEDYYLTRIFYRGNSTESIFELQYQVNDWENTGIEVLYGKPASTENGHLGFPLNLAVSKVDNYTGIASPFNYRVSNTVYESVDDIRIIYSYRDNLSIYPIAKYVYTDIEYFPLTNSYSLAYPSSYTPNWIIYRLPDVLLMKAEALVQLGGRDSEVMDLVNITYQRANPEASALDLSNYPIKSDLEALVLRERQRELLFEGKRWFDLVRLARREGSVNSLNNYVRYKMETTSSPLGATTMNAMYMPIQKSELNANPKLEQNPHYVETNSSNRQ